jgi:Flp pilus assembly pilin Flp
LHFVFAVSYRKRLGERDHVSRAVRYVESKQAKVVLRAILKFFHKDELGQDLAEYCLLTALVAMIALGIIYHVSGGMDGIWGSVHSSVASGNTGSQPARMPAN